MFFIKSVLMLASIAACSNTSEDTDVLECEPGQELVDGECLPVTTTNETGSPSATTEETGETGKTSRTGTDVPQDPAACSDSLVFEDLMDAVGQHLVGDFVVQLDKNGEVYAHHSDDIGQTVFHSAPGMWLAIGDHELHAEEHQGSFDIEITPTYTCENARFTELRKSGEALQFSGSFDDKDKRCEEATFTLEVCASSEGRLAFTFSPESKETLNFSRLRVLSNENERIYGMGEQFPHDTLNLNGRQIPVLAQEGGVGRGHPIISPAVNLASEGSAGAEETTYFAAPHYLTSDLHSLFLKSTAYAEFDFQPETHTEIRLHDKSMSWEAIYGATPLKLIEHYTEYAGRMPAPPTWTQDGAIVALARPLEESQKIVTELVDAGVSVAGVWNQTWSGINETFIGEQVLWNWVLDENEHTGWHDWVSDLDSQGIRTLCYVNSMFLDLSDIDTKATRHLFEEGEAGGYFVKNEFGETLLLPVTAFDVALLDFTNEAARDWMKRVIIDEMVEYAGCSGWMVDFAEALPFDAVLSDGSSAAEYHNTYPVAWMQLNREAIEEAGLLGDVLTFNRAGHTQSPMHSLMFWEGDQLTTWDKYDGLISAVHGLINGGFSGLTLNHSDTGGYTSLSWLGLGYSRESELLMRWAEMSAFTSLLRTHEGNQPEANAQIYDDDQLQNFAWASNVFAGLSAYRSQRFVEAQTMGWPVVRHLWLHYPEDEIAHETNDQFLLGSAFLVAPVVEKCAWSLFECESKREVYLPVGEWTHLWSGDVYTGPTSIEIDAPHQQPPVFYLAADAEAMSAVEMLRSGNLGVHK